MALSEYRFQISGPDTIQGGGLGTYRIVDVPGHTNPANVRIDSRRWVVTGATGVTNRDGSFTVTAPSATGSTGRITVFCTVVVGNTFDEFLLGTSKLGSRDRLHSGATSRSISQSKSVTVPARVPTLTVSITPSSTSVARGRSISLRASVSESGATLRWSLSGSGRLSATSGSPITYFAPSGTGNQETLIITVVATKGSRTARQQVAITLAGLAVLTTRILGIPESLDGGDRVTLRAVPSITQGATHIWTLVGPGRITSTTGGVITYIAPDATNADQSVQVFLSSTVGNQSATDSGSFIINRREAVVLDASIDVTGPATLAGGATGTYRLTTSGSIRGVRIRWSVTGGTIVSGQGGSELVVKAPASTPSNQAVVVSAQVVATLTDGTTRTLTDSVSVTIPAVIAPVTPTRPDPPPAGRDPYVRITPSALSVRGGSMTRLSASVFRVPGTDAADLFTLGESMLGSNHRLSGGAGDNPTVGIDYAWSAPVGSFSDALAREPVFTAPDAAAIVQNFAIQVQATINTATPIVVRYAINVAVAAADAPLPPVPPDPTITTTDDIPPVVPPSPPPGDGITVVIDRGGNVIRYKNQDPTRWLRGPMTWRSGRVYNSRKLGRSASGIASVVLQNNRGEWNDIRSDDFIAIYIDGISQWGGFVDEARNDGRRRRQKRRLRCLGAMTYLQDKTISIPPSRNVSLPVAMNLIYDACGVPHRFRGQVRGSYTFPWFWVDNITGKDAAHIVETTVRGFFHENAEGKLTLEAFADRQGVGTLQPISGAIATELNDNWERRIVAYQGRAVNTELTDEQVIAALSSDHVDMPIAIPAGGTLEIQVPRTHLENSVGIVDVQNIATADYSTVGSAKLSFTVAPSRDGVLIRATNSTRSGIVLNSVQVRGKHLVATGGITQFKRTEPGTEPEPIPAHLIQSSGEVNQIMTDLLALTNRGERVDKLLWRGARDRELARGMGISTRLRATDTDNVYVIEGINNRYRNGKRHELEIIVTILSAHSNLFVLGDSALGSSKQLL